MKTGLTFNSLCQKLRRASRYLFFIQLLGGIISSCITSEERHEPMTILQGKVKLQVPAGWKVNDTIPKFHDDILLDDAYFFVNSKYVCSAKLVNSNTSAPLAIYLRGDKIDLKEKNPLAVIIAESIDVNNNSVRIDVKYKDKGVYYYVVQMKYICEGKKIIFYFQLEDTSRNRKVINSIITSIQII